MEDCRKYKGYLITSGYEEKSVDEAFASQIIVKRKKLLTGKKALRRNISKKFRFVTDYEPAFSDIQRIIKTNEDVLRADEELKKVFPNGAKYFQISYRRGAANIKEILAPSRIILQDTGNEDIEQQPGSYPCGKGCVYCPVLRKTQGDRFCSTKIQYSYKVRQRIDCDSDNIIYLVTCSKDECQNFQGIGQSKQLKSRFSNY